MFAKASGNKRKGSQATGIEKKPLNGSVYRLSLAAESQTGHRAIGVHKQALRVYLKNPSLVLTGTYCTVLLLIRASVCMLD